ncbi:MAG: DinB family protein [Chitinophagaceae bacterium]
MTQQQIMLKSSLDAWYTYIGRADKLFQSFSDEELLKEVAPDRNSAAYLLGHLAAVHDGFFPMYGLGEKLYPQLEEVFIKNPDKSGLPKPSVAELRKAWTEVNSKLAEHFNKYTVDQWLEKHTAVSAEDFQKEPHRNKLNVLLNRTNHLANHYGQLLFLKK